MTRRETFTFVESSPEEESRKAYCRLCEDFTGKLNKLVPRYVDGIVDDKFKICSYCGEIYPIYDVKLFTEYEPKAQTVENPFDSGTRVDAIDRKRKYKQKKHVRGLDNDAEIPDFAGKEDTFLKDLQDEGAIIHSIDDSYDE